MASASQLHRRGHSSLWTPLGEPLFRTLWIAATVSYVGTWMQNVGAGWLMTSLTSSPLVIGLVQAAMSLPVFLVALPAGALADIVDRRRLLLVTQISMVVFSAALGILTLRHAVTPGVLLAFTFLLGLGTVMNDPAWQAITPEIVSTAEWAPAIALNSAAFNIARAVGPALGGVVIAYAGSGSAFLINAASFLGVILFLLRWKRTPSPVPSAGRERFVSAIQVGCRYMREDRQMRAVLVRTGLFSAGSSALWALLPLVARTCCGSTEYGVMLSCLGAGALCGASVLARLRNVLSADTLIMSGTLAFAAGSAALGSLHSLPWLYVSLFVAGAGWIVVVANLNVATQQISPQWVRARALSMYVLVLQGGLAVGSAFWGLIAFRLNISVALLGAAGALTLGIFASVGYPIRLSDFPHDASAPALQ